MDPVKWHIELTGGPYQVHPKEELKYLKEVYPDAKQNIPYVMPEPLGDSVFVTCFVDTDHAGNRVPRHSHICIIIYVNSAPIVW